MAPFLPPATVPWLATIAEPTIVTELQSIADNHAQAFVPDWQNLTSTNTPPSGWAAITLLNKGELDDTGCARAPQTCAALAALVRRGMMTPRLGAPDVGVRLLRLAPGASLRAHRGPGGRLVAHLGVRVPPAGATITADGESRRWRALVYVKLPRAVARTE